MSKIKNRLCDILGHLPGEQAQQLVEYAEFLLVKHGTEDIPSEPLAIVRPDEESVVAAIKRLRSTYPMLEPARLLNETYDLMTQHVMQGRKAVEVIDELEVLFRRHYEQRLNNKS